MGPRGGAWARRGVPVIDTWPLPAGGRFESEYLTVVAAFPFAHRLLCSRDEGYDVTDEGWEKVDEVCSEGFVFLFFRNISRRSSNVLR
jgi:hypothetical protein